MEFRLLGAVEARTPECQIDLGPRKQRLAFAVLALRVNQLVPVPRLVDLTWPSSPPQTAQHAIHSRVSRLRAALAEAGADRDGIAIVTHGSSYVLHADPMTVDAHRFRAGVVQASAETDDRTKVALLRSAVDLWHGPPLADVATPVVADQLCRGLEELQLAALEECLDAELRLGRHGAVLGELVELAAQHPYRPRLLAQLMLALHRAGRGPDALTAYRLARCRLADEVGLDPEPRLQQLATAILRADPALDLPGPAQPGPRHRPDADDGDAPAVEPAEGWPGGEPAMSDVTLEADRLTKTFGRRTAVADLSFTARQGEVLGLLGANGAGKTTTIRLLTTMLRPTRGDFAVAGIPSGRQAEIRGRVGVLPEGAGYPGHQTGLDYLSYHARLFGMRRAEATRTAARLLDELGLGDRARSRIATYSRGMRQRLGIARALLNAPAVILLDEPTLGLDPAGRHQVLGLLRDVARCTGATVLLSTNTLPEIREVCTDLLVLDEGRVALAGTVADVAPALAGTVADVTPALAGRQIGRVRVPPELADRAVEAVRDVPGLAVDVAADRPGVLRLSVAPAAGPGPGELPLNAVLQAVLSAGVPVLAYEAEDSRPAHAVAAGPGRSDRRS